MLVTKFWSWWHLRYVNNIDWTVFVGHFFSMSRQYLNCGLQLVKISGRRLLLNYSEWLQNGDPKIVTWQTRVSNRHYCNARKNGSILSGLDFQTSGFSSGTIKNINNSNTVIELCFQCDCTFWLFWHWQTRVYQRIWRLKSIYII